MTIKETAGKVLLYLYQMQRTAPLAMPNRQIAFIEKKDGSVGVTSDKKWLTKDLLSINSRSSDLYNAVMFLLDKEYIKTEERIRSNARVHVSINVTANGIDIIEGVDRGKDGQHEFEVAFNIKSSKNSHGTDELIKESLDDLLEAE